LSQDYAGRYSKAQHEHSNECLHRDALLSGIRSANGEVSIEWLAARSGRCGGKEKSESAPPPSAGKLENHKDAALTSLRRPAALCYPPCCLRLDDRRI